MQKNPRLSSMIDHLLRQSKRYKSVHAQWNESPLAQTTLTIRRVPAQQQCMVCFEKYQPARVEVSCPQCGSVGAKIIAGEEFYFESIEEENA